MTTIFNCADCHKAIKENSREHDDCWTDMEKDDDLWYCGDCKCDHMPNDDDFDEEPFFKTEEEEEEHHEPFTCSDCRKWFDEGKEKCKKCDFDFSVMNAVVCPYCDRNQAECEKNKENEKNPITDWCGEWGLSCDDCYYKNHPEEDDDASVNTQEVCCECELSEKQISGGRNIQTLHYINGKTYCLNCREPENSDDEESEGANDDDFTDCDACGYTHLCEDKCPNEATACHYEKWRE